MLAIFVGPNDDEKEASRFFDSFTPLDAPTSPSVPASPPPPLAPPNPMPSKQETRVGTVKVSGGTVIMEKAIKKVEPDYPPIARAAGVEGKVIVSIKTSAEGKVLEATIIEGHPLLRDSVLRAAKQWEFKPSELSGVPVKVQAELTFHFTLK
jgi:TonB family protein